MQNKTMKKMLAALLAAAMTAGGLLTGCGGTGSADPAPAQESARPEAGEAGETGAPESGTEEAGADVITEADTFTMVLNGNVDAQYYDDYNDNPSVRRWLDMSWDADGDGKGQKIAIDFWQPPTDGASDYFTTMLATAEYPDVLSLIQAGQSPLSLYEDGVILDLTDYVAEYMPNLTAWLDAHPNYVKQLTTEIDGEQRLLELPTVSNTVENAWGCYNYRRDWLVKYGKNPETGAAFTGGYDDEGEWSDDVVFPSGNSDPYYISDWEWMLGIFQTALESEGITDGYALQLPPRGYVDTGDMSSGFGVCFGYGGYYFDKDGKVQFGMANDSARAYLQCVRQWYENGWINPTFEEFPMDTMWFLLDPEHVYTGSVGLWYGMVAQWGSNLDTGTSPYTEGICVMAAPQPINDVYGDESCQNHEPTMFYENSLAFLGAAITNKAEKKDLPTLFTALDYLYSKEGGMLRYLGLSNDMVSELDAAGVSNLYTENGLHGGYAVEERDGEEWYLRTEIQNIDDSLKVALNMVRIPVGMSWLENVDYGYKGNFEHNMEMANMYEASAYTGLLGDKLSTDQAQEQSMVMTNTGTYTAQVIPQFVKGELDIDDDAVWQDYVDTVESFGVDTICGYLNEAAGNK